MRTIIITVTESGRTSNNLVTWSDIYPYKDRGFIYPWGKEGGGGKTGNSGLVYKDTFTARTKNKKATEGVAVGLEQNKKAP